MEIYLILGGRSYGNDQDDVTEWKLCDASIQSRRDLLRSSIAPQKQTLQMLTAEKAGLEAERSSFHAFLSPGRRSKIKNQILELDTQIDELHKRIDPIEAMIANETNQ